MRAGKRMLIQAPSGSGKTVLCVKVVAELLAEKVATQTSPLFPAPAPGPGEEVVLLLGHSVALVQQMTAELVAELEHRTGVTVQREPLDGCPVGHGVLVHVVGCPKVAVHVLTVDELVDADRNHAATYLGAVEPLKYAAAVVDEGHLVFSHQPYAWLDGQHRCKASEVRWVLERRLAVAGAAVVVFHDTSYQHVAAEPPEYPERCFRSIVPLPIVRNPGPVRDCSVPFCEELQTSNDSGRAKLFPLLEECIEEVSASRGGDDEMAVRMVDVRWGCDGYKGKKTLSTVLYNRAKKERQGDNRDGTEAVSREQSTNYAGVIVRELDRIRDDWADWERSVAVLVPGSPEGLPAELLAAAVVVADSKPELAVVAAALRRVEVSVVNDGTLYFGAVENFAGLERPVVVVSGMRHPRYVAHRVQHERWTATSGRVDARVYLAVTRCTVYLVVAEMEAKTFAAHYGVSAVARQGGGPAQLRGEWTRDKIEEASQVYLEPLNRGPDGRGFWTIRLQVTVDLDAPPAPRDLATAVSVQLRVGNRPHMLDRTKWDETSFLWEHCASGIRELDVVEQLGPNLANEAGLVYLGVCDLADLAVLTLSKNAIESVPAEIGQLTGLRRLVLSENNLRSMPATVGRLTALTELNLNDNELESLPVEIGNLVALTLLRLDANRLRALPQTMRELKSLKLLFVEYNFLVYSTGTICAVSEDDRSFDIQPVDGGGTINCLLCHGPEKVAVGNTVRFNVLEGPDRPVAVVALRAKPVDLLHLDVAGTVLEVPKGHRHARIKPDGGGCSAFCHFDTLLHCDMLVVGNRVRFTMEDKQKWKYPNSNTVLQATIENTAQGGGRSVGGRGAEGGAAGHGRGRGRGQGAAAAGRGRGRRAAAAGRGSGGRVCRFFRTRRGCRNGAACPFDHT
eukprot:m.375911 g.375911  ORF g.375911 m.375911 type:complete len:907 (+) comp28188_c3_seq3:1151-3871(+)